jgi:DNA-binding Lrp family transcriptional regulator
MDLRDFEILYELQRNPFASYAAIGRAVRVSAPAVKSRLDRLERDGVYRGMYVIPRPQSLRRIWHIFAYTNVDPTLDVQQVLSVDNVVSVWWGDSGEYMVNTFDRSGDLRPPKSLRKVIGQEAVGVVSLDPPSPGPNVEFELSPLDWRVVDALIDAPRSSLVALSTRTGLSPRTVRRRREALLSKQLILALPGLDTSKEPGLIVYGGYVGVRKLEDLDSINLPGLVIFRRLYNPPAAWFMGHSETYSELQSTERRLRASPGVVSVNIGPSRPASFATHRIHSWIRAEIRRWEPARRRRV